MSPRPVVALVLAAGAARRLGRPKASLPLADGRAALDHVLDAAAGVVRAVVVAGHAPEEVERVLAARAARGEAAPAAACVVNARWALGRTTSIHAGLAALPPPGAGIAAPPPPGQGEPSPALDVLLWPVDVCLVGAGVVAHLLAARAGAPDADGWVPSHAGRRGHPVLLAPPLQAALRTLAEDAPARDAVRAAAAAGRLVHVEVDDPAVLWDVDTPADLARTLAEHARRRAGPRGAAPPRDPAAPGDPG